MPRRAFGKLLTTCTLPTKAILSPRAYSETLNYLKYLQIYRPS